MNYYYTIAPKDAMGCPVYASRSDCRAIKEARRKARQIAIDDGRDMLWSVTDENGNPIAAGVCHATSKEVNS